MKAVLAQPTNEAPATSVTRNVGAMVAASIANAVSGIILMFWIPRLIPVDSFGYWRSFLLYCGYAGFLHLGLVDGALLNWSRPRNGQIGPFFPQTLGALGLQHVILSALGLALLLTPLEQHAHFREILPALLVYALLFNLAGLVQVYLQTRLRFAAVALGMSAPGALFVLGVAVLRQRTVTLDALLIAFLLAWGITLVVLLIIAARTRRNEARPDTFLQGQRFFPSAKHIAAGWPIMLANTSYGLMQSADRIAVNLARPIHDFAVYSLSQSTIYVPVTIIAAVSRVAFSHFAGVDDQGRELAYRGTVRLLTLLWMLLLPYYFLVEWVVGRFLPRYVPGLPAGKVLLFSVLFLSLISIVQANAWNLAGEQRRFLLGSVAAMLVALLTAWLAATGIGTGRIGAGWTGSLTAVAWSQVFTAALWWIGNERATRKGAPLDAKEIVRVLAAFAAAAGGLLLISWWNGSVAGKIALYYLFEAVPLFLLFRSRGNDRLPSFRSIFTRRIGAL